eukprot:298868-Rhodomonas_salina.1
MINSNGAAVGPSIPLTIVSFTPTEADKEGAEVENSHLPSTAMAGRNQDFDKQAQSSWRPSPNASRDASTGVSAGYATDTGQPKPPKADERDYTKTVTRGAYEAVKGVQYGTVDFIQDIFGAPKEAATATTFTEPMQFEEKAVGPERLEIPEPFQKDVSYVADVFKNMTYVDENAILSKVEEVKSTSAEMIKTLRDEMDEMKEQYKELQQQNIHLTNQINESNTQSVFQSVQNVQQQEADEFGSFWFQVIARPTHARCEVCCKLTEYTARIHMQEPALLVQIVLRRLFHAFDCGLFVGIRSRPTPTAQVKLTASPLPSRSRFLHHILELQPSHHHHPNCAR